jgi:hypothetical protein
MASLKPRERGFFVKQRGVDDQGSFMCEQRNTPLDIASPTRCATRCVLFSMLISRFPLIIAKQANEVKNLSNEEPSFRETSTSDQDSLPDQKDRALSHWRTFCTNQASHRSSSVDRTWATHGGNFTSPRRVDASCAACPANDVLRSELAA